MRPVKLKQRINHAVDAFFAVGNKQESQSIGLAGETYALRNNYSSGLPEKDNSAARFLKRAFLFFPGTIILFFLSFIGAFIYLNNPFKNSVPFISKLWIVSLLFSASIMTWYGIGDLKNSKHCVVPSSIVLVGVIAAVISVLLPAGYGFSTVGVSAYPFYFLPAALALPFIAKGLADRSNAKAV